LDAEGDASCERCHLPPDYPHHEHEGLNTCSDCHAPEPDGHAARPVTCTTCHDMHGGMDGAQSATTDPSAPLPDTTKTAPTTTIPPPDATATNAMP
ncbi:MAG: hypothetical protein ACC683_12455, partial [Acidimicrobiia bacterium]